MPRFLQLLLLEMRLNQILKLLKLVKLKGKTMIQKKYIDVKLLEVQKKMENTEPEESFLLEKCYDFFP